MKLPSFILVVILASGASLTVLAESDPASAQNSTIPDTSTPPAATSAQATIPKSQRNPSTDPPAASHAGRLTGSVLGVDPHARIITVKMDHSVDNIHTGDQIHMDKAKATHKTARHHRPIHRKTRTATTGAAQRTPAPTIAPGKTAIPPAAKGSVTPNIAPSDSNSSVKANSGAATATLSPAPSPTVAPPQSTPSEAATPGESNAPTTSEIPPEIGLVPRRSGGYVPGGSTSGGL